MKFDAAIKWTGSKRRLSEEIIRFFPRNIDTYYEPFCGSCSMMFQLLCTNIEVKRCVCSDVNADLIGFFNLLKTNPLSICKEYECRWNILHSLDDLEFKKSVYYKVRDNYNKTKNVHDFFFLTRHSINGQIRYNSKGEFNASYNPSQHAITPQRLKKTIAIWHIVLKRSNVEFLCRDYREITTNENDYVFLDPPYPNTTGFYYGKISVEDMWKWIRSLKCKYSLTFDGIADGKDITYDVPSDIYSKHIYLKEKLSSYRNITRETDKPAYVAESLYIK